MNIIRAVAYICCQLCGALLGSFIVQELVPQHMKASLHVLVDSKSSLLNNVTVSRIVRAIERNSKNINYTVKAAITNTTSKSITSQTVSTASLLASGAMVKNGSEVLKTSNISGPYNLGLTLLNKNLTTSQGVGIEIIITFILMLTVFACLDTHRKDLGGSFPLTIGLAVTIGCFFGVKLNFS